VTDHVEHCAGNNTNLLALDTACGEIAACIIQHGQYYISPPDARHTGTTRSTSIVPLLNTLLEQAGLDWKQLDVLALGAGPGSFTGLRIAAATLAGINAGRHLPIVHLSSLAITARQADPGESTEPDAPVRVLEDARAGEVFCGYYQQGAILEADTCLQWSEMAALKPGNYCCHSEPQVDLQSWKRLALTQPRSQALALEAQASCAAVDNWSAVPIYPAPVYLQLSQAKRNAHGA